MRPRVGLQVYVLARRQISVLLVTENRSSSPSQSVYGVNFVTVWMSSSGNERYWGWHLQFEATSCRKMSFPERYLFLILDTAVSSLHSYKISTPQDVTKSVHTGCYMHSEFHVYPVLSTRVSEFCICCSCSNLNCILVWLEVGPFGRLTMMVMDLIS